MLHNLAPVGWVGRAYSVEVVSAEIPFRGGGGPVQFWDNPKTGTLIQLNDAISTLDLLCQAEIEVAAKVEGRANESTRRAIVMNALEFVNSTGEIAVAGIMRNDVLWNLSKVMSKEEFGRLLALMPDPEISFSKKDWKVSYTVITAQKAIERRTYSGGLDPITFKRTEVDVIAPPGTVPKASVLPGPDGWQPGDALK